MALVLAVSVIALGACGESSPASPRVRAAAVYDTVIRWFVTETTAGMPEPPETIPVFVEPRGEGAIIKLEVQADVVSRLQDAADVRFVDDREEALGTDDDGAAVVVDGGILLRLSPVVEEGDRVTLEVDQWLQERLNTYLFTLTRVDDLWTIVGEPQLTGTRPA